MTTTAYVLGAALVVAAELVFALAHFDSSAVSDRATRVEDRLDRELHHWVLSSPGERPQGSTAEHDGAGSST